MLSENWPPILKYKSACAAYNQIGSKTNQILVGTGITKKQVEILNKWSSKGPPLKTSSQLIQNLMYKLMC